MLINVILLSSDCFKVQGHLVPRLFCVSINVKIVKFNYYDVLVVNIVVVNITSPFYSQQCQCRFLKALTGKTITLDVNSSDRTETPKAKIEEKEDVPLNYQRLTTSRGKNLDGGKTLSSYNIQKGSTLYMRPKGGMRIIKQVLCDQKMDPSGSGVPRTE